MEESPTTGVEKKGCAERTSFFFFLIYVAGSDELELKARKCHDQTIC